MLTIAWLALFVGVGLLSLRYLLPELPAQVYAYDHEQVIKIVDRDGTYIGSQGLEKAGPVPLEELPHYLPAAVLAVEDRRFYWHMGIDVFGLARAAYENWRAGSVVQGGSTLTQQLAKNMFLTPERTLDRKIEEAKYALWLEQKLTKEEILELYLNKVYLGAGTYGVEAAAQRYFQKSARDVTLVEAALLAGLLKAPSRYAPTASLSRASQRTELVLTAMVDAGFLTEEQRQDAYSMPARIRPRAATNSSQFITDWVSAQLADYLGPISEDVIVTTTLDLDIQRSAEAALADTLAQEGGKAKVGDGAIVTLAQDGAVLALVGGRNYQTGGFNRATQARRPPGSAFKPFVYLAAMEAGWRPNDVMLDAPIEIGNWAPENYDGRFRGAVTLEAALAKSINTVAVRLGDKVGRDMVIDTARRFGILSPLRPLPSLSLGTQEVSLFELASAYVPFANGGYSALPYSIISIRSMNGELIYSRQVHDPEPVASDYSIGAINLMLHSATGWGTGRAARVEGYEIAGKTGTSGEYRDGWYIGYTADYVTGVWLGNDDNSPMNKITGGSLPARIWNRHMAQLLVEQPPRPLPHKELAIPPPYLGQQGFAASGDLEVDMLPPPDFANLGEPAETEPPQQALPQQVEKSSERGLFSRIANALRNNTPTN